MRNVYVFIYLFSVLPALIEQRYAFCLVLGDLGVWRSAERSDVAFHEFKQVDTCETLFTDFHSSSAKKNPPRRFTLV